MKLEIACIGAALLLSGCGGGGGGSDGYFVASAVADDSADLITVTPPAEEQRMYEKIIIVGDSIMAGSISPTVPATINHDRTTSALLLTQHSKNVTNLSLSGQTLGNALNDNLTGAINYLTYNGKLETAVWIEVTHNDWAWGWFTIDQFRANYTAFLGELAAIDGDTTDVYCALATRSRSDSSFTLNVHGDLLEDYRQVVREVAADTGACTLVESDLWFDDADVYDPTLFPDGLHPGDAGHAAYTLKLLEAIEGWTID